MDLFHDPVLTDAELVAACATVIDRPKAAPPASFELHAPLELLARSLLLDRIPESAHELARERLRWLATEYVDAGPSAPPQPDPPPFAPDAVVTSLAAAGHAPILFSLRPRVDAVPTSFGDRLVATELARHPDWRLEWPARRDDDARSSGDLTERLALPPSPGDPESNSIYPTMHLVDVSGLAAKVLEEPLVGLDVDAASRTLQRVAAQSMLQDTPAAAPYGWTHCLTMPQAVLVAAGAGVERSLAIAVAATYVLGFRSTLGQVRLDAAWEPAPETAAARAWFADDDQLPAIVDELVTVGAVHPDAHLAKYTLACLDAAAGDTEATRLFLAAALQLQEWWSQHPPTGDPILARLGEHLPNQPAHT